MKEDNNLFSRVKRYSQVTTSVSSLASRFAGKKYLNLSLDDKKFAAQITQILGNLKGPLMKVAQLSSTIPDLLPPEYAKKLSELLNGYNEGIFSSLNSAISKPRK